MIPLDIIRTLPHSRGNPRVLPNKEDPPWLSQLSRISRDNGRTCDGRADSRRSRVLQVHVLCPSGPSSLPDAVVKSSSKNPLLADAIAERTADFCLPSPAMNGGEDNRGTEVDRGVEDLVAASRSTAPEEVLNFVQNGESRWIWRACKVARLVDGLKDWERPVNAVFSGGEPDMTGLVTLKSLSQPGKVEFTLECMENGGRGSSVTGADGDWGGIPIARTVGALVADVGVATFALPCNVEIAIEAADGGSMVTLGTSSVFGGEVVRLVDVGVRVVGGSNPEDNGVVSGAIAEPQFTVPNFNLSLEGYTRISSKGMMECQS